MENLNETSGGARAVTGNINKKTISHFKASAHTTSWLEALHVQHIHNNTNHSNNNNDDVKSSSLDNCHYDNIDDKEAKSSVSRQCVSCDNYKLNYRVNPIENGEVCNDNLISKKDSLTCNGSDSKEGVDESALPISETDIGTYDLCGAVSLTPPCLDEQFYSGSAAAAAGGTSNRTSLNNSTENLSYISDSFCADDVLILGEDADVEAEELSLNSDDCIYAYRGEGADFDLPLDSLDGGLCSINGLPQRNCAEEETDFLEMDFEPDPSSELEFNHINTSSVSTNMSMALNTSSSTIATNATKNQYHRHQLFSSPINDVPPPTKGLQSQSMLIKNFAQITLHLDQIQRDYQEESDLGLAKEISTNSTKRNITSTKEAAKEIGTTTDCNQINSLAYSLPNASKDHFSNRSISESAVVMGTNESRNCDLITPLNILMQNSSHLCDSKITGAKPKRLSTTFSSTSSTSSKNSSKSRHSLRSTLQPPVNLLCGNNGFDERSVSCSEFRTEYDLLSSHTATVAPLTATMLNAPDSNSFMEDTCLDCLEKEFLASTIGKTLNTKDCTKCHKHLGNIMYQQKSLSKQCYSQSQSQSQPHFGCSNSPNMCNNQLVNNEQTSPTSRLFSYDLINTQVPKRKEWNSFLSKTKWNDNIIAQHQQQQENHQQFQHQIIPLNNHTNNNSDNSNKDSVGQDNEIHNQSNTKNFEKEISPGASSVTISTKNFTIIQFEQVLEQLNVIYDKDLLYKHFAKCCGSSYPSSTSNEVLISRKSLSSQKERYNHKNLLQFVMYASKRPINYGKLSRSIEKITQSQITIQYEKESTQTNNIDMVEVNVSDILYYWSLDRNLEQLKQLDQRFNDNNVLGKIANIIRQSRWKGTVRRSLPESIYIPQYYPNGYLIFTKKS